MNRVLIAVAILVVFAGCSSGGAMVQDDQASPKAAKSDAELVQRYQASITASELSAMLYFFASDHFEGRETAARGQRLAAAYLASEYSKLGVPPAREGTAGNYDPEAYMQPFPLYGRRLQSAKLRVSNSGHMVGSLDFPAATDNGYLAFGNIEDVAGGVVFGGYGIADDALGYNDFAALNGAGISVGNSWLMILRDEPMADAETSLLPTEGNAVSTWTTQPTKKFNALFGSGLPAGILVVGDAGPRTNEIAVRGTQAARAQESGGRLSLNPGATASRPFPPIYVISTELADAILGPSGKTIADIEAKIAADLEPVTFRVPDVTVSSKLAFETYETSSENVAALIEGSDPALKHETIVISSHYDHIGVQAVDSGDSINNGADDDGSGTVTILEIADAFMQAVRDGNGPRRSILFLNVSGEEKGLLGSAYYADVEPLRPLESTVTNLNIDMVGRYDPSHPTGSKNYVYIIGSKLISQELHDINETANTSTGINLELDERFNSKDDPNRFYARSDHWNFGKHGIPFIFYFTGTHEDYHQPGDEAHKIEYDRMARIAKLIFATTWEVANRDEAPAKTGEGFN